MNSGVGNLRMLRAKYGLTQEDMAKTLKISTLAYRQKESGKRQFTLDEAKTLSEVLNQTIDEIFFAKDVHEKGTKEDYKTA